MSKKNAKGANQKDIWKKVKAYSGFYLMFLPVFIFVLIVYYWPMSVSDMHSTHIS